MSCRTSELIRLIMPFCIPEVPCEKHLGSLQAVLEQVAVLEQASVPEQVAVLEQVALLGVLGRPICN